MSTFSYTRVLRRDASCKQRAAEPKQRKFSVLLWWAHRASRQHLPVPLANGQQPLSVTPCMQTRHADAMTLAKNEATPIEWSHRCNTDRIDAGRKYETKRAKVLSILFRLLVKQTFLCEDAALQKPVSQNVVAVYSVERVPKGSSRNCGRGRRSTEKYAFFELWCFSCYGRSFHVYTLP